MPKKAKKNSSKSFKEWISFQVEPCLNAYMYFPMRWFSKSYKTTYLIVLLELDCSSLGFKDVLSSQIFTELLSSDEETLSVTAMIQNNMFLISNYVSLRAWKPE